MKKGIFDIRVVCVLAVSYFSWTAGCRQKMAEQPSIHRPLKPLAFFDDDRSARPFIPDTVARGHLNDDPHFVTGKVNNEYVKTFPFAVTDKDLLRGRQRFEIFCAVCHDAIGTGNGKIVQRGFTHPPNFQTDDSRGYRLRGRDLSLRKAPVGYFFEVITNGFGAMPDYREQVPPRDRWVIIAHIRVLQLSQNFPLDDLPKDHRDKRFPMGDTP